MKLRMPEIDCMLTVSTAHITSKDAELLRLECVSATSGIVYELGEYGWLIYTHSHTFRSPRLKRLIELANNHECAFLRLDRDGPVHSELPTFNW